MSYNSKYTGAQVEELLEKAGTALQSVPDEYVTKADIEPLNASFEDFGGEAEEPELPWVVYTDGVVGDINTILDNINGESA